MPRPKELLQGVKTKIVATVGPASESAEKLEQLILAGVDVFRLNFAHGDWDSHSSAFQRIRAASAALGKPVAVLQDLGGPKLRLGELPGGAARCALGERWRFVQAPSGRPGELACSYPGLMDDLGIGDSVLVADGTVGFRVVHKAPGVAELEVTLPGEIRSRQGVNVPGVRLSLEGLTAKDVSDLDWTARHEVDFVGLSFVRRPEDVVRLREELRRRQCAAQIVAKIEKREALVHLEGILQCTDAVMVARGDLGVEVDVAQVPVVQKRILQRCRDRGVPAITATQMLESMRWSNRPTRAEASDVANAILDGTDAVMLSAETATGSYPVEAVQTMNRIAWEAEQYLATLPPTPPVQERELTTLMGMVEAAGRLADRLKARLVVAATHAGHTALALAKQRNLTPTLGLSAEPATVRRQCLYWGVLPVLFPAAHGPAEYVEQVAAWAKREGLASLGDRLVFVFGSHGPDLASNSIVEHTVE